MDELLTDLVKFNSIEFGTHFAQESLGGLTKWAVRLAKDR